MDKEQNTIQIAMAWCLAWGNGLKPQVDLEVLHQMRQAMNSKEQVPEAVRSYVEEAQRLDTLQYPRTIDELTEIVKSNPKLWDSRIGLVYGGATKIKRYVFEASKLPDIRGASALLDRINLVDLPAFFHAEESKRFKQCQQASEYCQQVRTNWLDQKENYPGLSQALIPELIIYSTGGNILAFCPAAFVNDLADAVEKRYTEETLTANSCAVGATFRPLELCFGLLPDKIEDAHWLDWYRQNRNNDLVKAYFAQPDEDDPEKEFRDRKSFNELAGKLASLFNQRRNGNDWGDRSTTRRYPIMFETHPYLVRDQNDRCSAIGIPKPPEVPSEVKLSEALARKKVVGQIAKREFYQDNLPKWFKDLNLEWQPTGISIKSWVSEFEDYLSESKHQALKDQYFASHKTPEEARSLREIGNVSHPRGFVAYIYADGNNMGGYIQKIKTPQEYKRFSQDIFEATEQSVYKALAEHLEPRRIEGLSGEESENRNGKWIHPFEILTIGGDDVMLIVPADQALAIAQTIGEKFEIQLRDIQSSDGQYPYRTDKAYEIDKVHRYKASESSENQNGSDQCKLSMSTGVLITAEDTPIYYAQELANQLLKSAKKTAKTLKSNQDYYGGTIDFLVMKSVTMISSNISEFRKQGLTKYIHGEPKLRLYATPYTLHEIGGLLKTLEALKKADFPRSQLYQIRSLLEQGKNTAILNYRYFQCRLKQGQQELQQHFEEAWCKAKTNDGNLAPWMSSVDEEKTDKNKPSQDKTNYETIWRELVDLYPFVLDADEQATSKQPSQASNGDKP